MAINKYLYADDLRFSSTGIGFTNNTEYNIGFRNLPHGIYQLSLKRTSTDADSYYVHTFAVNGTSNFHTLQELNHNYSVDPQFSSSVDPRLQVNTTGTHEYSIIKLI
ncbi:hypothetical protein OAA60_01410 [Porticoccaceae bacterium]|nr:hypothetical protein [Porticoccaceae bacterium]